MHKRLTRLALSCLFAAGLVVSSCATAQTPVATRDAVDEDGVVRRGAKLAGAPSTPVDQAYARSTELNGKTIALTGTIIDECKDTGCWFTIADRTGDLRIRITTTAQGISIPRNAIGMMAIVEGTLRAHGEELRLDVTALELHKVI